MPRIIVTVPGSPPQPYRFSTDRQSIRIGRGHHNDIVLDSRSISMNHAEIQRIGSTYLLRDLGSTNGIRLDAEYRDRIDLAEPGSVVVGDVALTFELTDEEIAALDAEPALPPQRAAETFHDERPVRRRKSVGFSGDGIFWLVLLAIVATIAGTSVRHHQETGGNFVSEVWSALNNGGAER